METKEQPLNLNSGTIQISNIISLKAKQSWMYMVYKAFEELGNKNIFQISQAELKKAIQYTSRNDKHFKETLKELAECKVEFNIFNKDGSGKWLITHLLASCEIDDSTALIEYEFSEKLKNKLMFPVMYAKLNLLISQKFKSKHSLAIYTLAIDYLIKKQNYGEKNLTVEELKRFLGLIDNEGKENCKYRVVDIHKHILKKAEKEINEISDMNMKIDVIKDKLNSRKIFGFKFKWKIKNEHLGFYQKYKSNSLVQIPMESYNIIFHDNSLNNFFIENKLSFAYESIQTKLKSLKSNLKENFEKYLIYLKNYSESEYKKGNVKVIAGFYISLLQTDNQLDIFIQSIKKTQDKENNFENKVKEKFKEKLYLKYKEYVKNEFKIHLKDNYNIHKNVFIKFIMELENRIPLVINNILNKHQGNIDINLLEEPVIISNLLLQTEKFDYYPPTFQIWETDFLNNSENKVSIKQLEQLALNEVNY